MNTMKFTYDVIFPIYSVAPSTKLSIQSAIDQTLPYNKFIAIIDCLPSESHVVLTLLDNVPRLILIFSSDFNCNGAGPCRQLGIDHSSSDYIAFLDSDDVWHPRKSELQFDSLTTNDHIFSFSSYLAVNDTVSCVLFASTVYFFELTRIFLLIFNPIANSSVIVRRSALQNIGGYSSLHVRNDFHTWIRLLFSLKYSGLQKK